MKNKLLLVPVFVVTCFFANVTFSQDLSDELLLHYEFDGDATDASVNEYDGTESGVIYVEDRNGNPGSACYFDGVDDFIDLPNIPALKPDLPVSFAFWVKFDVIDAFLGVVLTTDFATNEHSGVWMNLSSSGKMVVNYGDASGNTSSPNRRSKVGTTDLESDRWYHVVGVIRGTLDMDIYIDCENDNGTYSGTGSELAYTDAAGSIGRKDSDFTGPAHYFKGTLDDLRYWERALTEDEVLALCNDNETNQQVEEVKFAQKVMIHPNPTSDILTITLLDAIQPVELILTDLSGKQVLRSNFQTSLDLSSLVKGTYILAIRTENQVYTSKVVRF